MDFSPAVSLFWRHSGTHPCGVQGVCSDVCIVMCVWGAVCVCVCVCVCACVHVSVCTKNTQV